MPLLGFAGVSSAMGMFNGMRSSVAASASADQGKVMGQGPFGAKYYLQGALAGGICCSITHGALTPVDVVKTRIQLDPVKYNQGFIGGFKQVISGEGAGALLTGLGPTAQGYFIQVSPHAVAEHHTRPHRPPPAPPCCRACRPSWPRSCPVAQPPGFTSLIVSVASASSSHAGLVQVWRRRVLQD